jgi:glycosyltransferase involved in cell wall biosynthesis
MRRRPPKISVLTCCYNAEDFVEEAIESILHQSYEDFEYVLVDDGSTDNTLSILKKYAARDRRIVLIETEHSGSGQTEASNVGLAQTKGEWIARLDADDVALPDRLLQQLHFAQENNGVMLLGGGCIEIDKNGTVIKKHSYPQGHDALMKRLENGEAFFPHSSVFFNRSKIVELGGYNRKFIRSLDADLYLRVGEIAPIGCLQIPVVKLRKHSQTLSKTNSGRIQMLMGTCATICHFRRKAGLSDLSQMEEDTWQEFLKWIEIRMEEEEVFQQKQTWQKLRKCWYNDLQKNTLGRIKGFLEQLIRDPLARKSLWRHFRKNNLTLKWAKESRILF